MGFFARLFGQQEHNNKKNHYVFTDEDRQLSAEILAKKKEIALKQLEDESRLQSLRSRAKELSLRADIEEQKDRLAEYEPDDDYEDELMDSPNVEMYRMFKPAVDAIASKIAGNNTVSPETYTFPPSQPSISPTVEVGISPKEGRSLSNEQLLEQWKNTPNMAKSVARTMNDEQIRDFIKSKYPPATDGDIKAAISIIRTGAPA